MALTDGRVGLRLLRRLASRRSQRWVLAGLAALALAAAVDGVQLWRVQRWNAAIAAAADVPLAALPASAASGTAAASGQHGGAIEGVPEWQFAQAHALAGHGQTEAALSLYGRLTADPLLGAAARLNSANLLLRQGLVQHAGAQPGQALALIELAKEGYRELLRQDPGQWPARYNLERAQRLVPDPEAVDDEPAAPARDAERSATTTRGDPLGLP